MSLTREYISVIRDIYRTRGPWAAVVHEFKSTYQSMKVRWGNFRDLVDNLALREDSRTALMMGDSWYLFENPDAARGYPERRDTRQGFLERVLLNKN